MEGADQVVIFGKPRDKDSRESREGHGHGGQRAALNHRKESPAVEESDERRKGFAQVDVHPAGARHHGGEFAVGERGGHRKHAGQRPGHQHAAGAADVPRHVGRDDKDARADHRAGHSQHRVKEAEAANKAVSTVGIGLRPIVHHEWEWNDGILEEIAHHVQGI